LTAVALDGFRRFASDIFVFPWSFEPIILPNILALFRSALAHYLAQHIHGLNQRLSYDYRMARHLNPYPSYANVIGKLHIRRLAGAPLHGIINIGNMI
jgi:hypothetical protein